MPVRISIESAEGGSYDYRIGAGCIASCGTRLCELPALADCNRMLLLTDSNAGPLYAEAVKDSLGTSHFAVDRISIPAGEKSKSLDVASEIWSAMSQLGMNRQAAVCALGGGVVGDLAGFVAATFMRGIPLVHVPTSLLAMVDSSIGGKTAVDIPEGKNLVGAFHQPAAVFADTSVLASLPPAEFRNGLAEVAKSALLSDDDFFFWLEDHARSGACVPGSRDPEAIEEMIVRSVLYKSRVVARDPYEKSGIRAYLNLGHTFGHALECCSGYALSHGACVAEGIRFAARVAQAHLGSSPEFTRAQDSLLDSLGLCRLPVAYDCGRMLCAMRSDKKNVAGGVRFVLLRDLGKPELCTIEPGLVEEYLKAWKEAGS